MDDLYRFAEEQGYIVCSFPLPETKSLSLPLTDTCYIGMDSSTHMSAAEECCHLGHELGHCVYSGFYTRFTPFDLKEQHERRADIWFIKRQIPLNLLKYMLHAGMDVEEIADRLTVTEDYVVKAYYYYKESGETFSDYSA